MLSKKTGFEAEEYDSTKFGHKYGNYLIFPDNNNSWWGDIFKEKQKKDNETTDKKPKTKFKTVADWNALEGLCDETYKLERLMK